MRCSHCGAERLKNITVQGESCTCKHCGAEFTVQTSADNGREAVIYCSRLPQPKIGRPAARRICITLPPHQIAWAQSQPKASPAVAVAIQFYLDSIKPKRGKRATVSKPI